MEYGIWNTENREGALMIDEKNVYFFIIMEKLGKSLSHYKENNRPFSLKTVAQIGIQVIESYEILHHFGYIHNDL